MTNLPSSSSTNASFVLRLTWDSEAGRWLILVKPTDKGEARVFEDLESAFLYIAKLTTKLA